jgi:hypothetical protein
MGENALGADNQQERLRVDLQFLESSETTRQSPLFSRSAIQAYLFGAMHDGTIRHSDHRYRIAQKGTEWLLVIQRLLESVHYKSWIYQEGKTRNVYILESVAPIFRESFDPYQLRTDAEKVNYIRGFFDAEGGIPQSLQPKKYIQLVQKDYQKIQLMKDLLNGFNIATGKIHNPSKNVDPDYWRIFVSLPSIPQFVKTINSWHPRKNAIFAQWMKI